MVTNNQNGKTQTIKANWNIKATEVRLIGMDGANLGVVKIGEGIRQAQEAGMDLLEINGKSNPPVCKIMSIGKYKYDEKKQASKLKKTAVVSELKEIQLHPNTNIHDIETKTRAAKEFLEEGHRVKFTVKFRGRENSHQELGYEQLKNIFTMLGEKVVMISDVKSELKAVSMIVGKEK